MSGGCAPADDRTSSGVHAGVQTERNRAHLRATHARSRVLNLTEYAWIAPGGGRAVAVSSPVSPTRTSCKVRLTSQRCIERGCVAGCKSARGAKVVDHGAAP